MSGLKNCFVCVCVYNHTVFILFALYRCLSAITWNPPYLFGLCETLYSTVTRDRVHRLGNEVHLKREATWRGEPVVI